VAIASGVALATGTLLDVARQSMVEQVERAEKLAVQERAAALSDALDSAQRRLDVNANLTILRDAFEHEDAALLSRALRQTKATPGVVAATVYGRHGQVVASTEEPGLPDAGAEAETRFRPGSDPAHGHAFLTAKVADDDGHTIGHVVQELDLSALTPQLTKPIPYTDGALTVMDGRGRTVLTTRAARPKGDEITAGAPVPGARLRVVVTVAASAAAGPATTLVWKLTGILLVLFGGIAVTVGATTTVLVRSRRRLRRQHDSAVELARLDPLTGLANRRALDQQVDAGLSLDGWSGVIAVDIDDLKALNDAHGHTAGDDGIRAVGRALVSAVRPADHVARTGGDEFVVLLPDVTDRDVERIAGRIRVALAAAEVPGVGPVSASVGISHGTNDQLRALIRRADERLYEAKRLRVLS
jgi:diguanylate cyclase (GGDEF)-like protein